MQTCDVIAELGDAYALGLLDPAEARQLEEHVEKCPPCRAQLDADIAAAAALALAPPQVEPPARLRDALLAAARGQERPPARQRWWRGLFPSPTRLALGAASFASLAFVVTLTWALSLQSELARPPMPAPP